MKTYIYQGENSIVRTRFDDEGKMFEAEVLYDENAIEIDEGESEVEEEDEDVPVPVTPAKVAKAVKTAVVHNAKMGCDECLSTGWRHKKGCPKEGKPRVAAEPSILSKTDSVKLNEEERKYHSFKAPLSEKQYRQVRLRRIEEMPMTEVTEEFECSEATVRRVWAASTYDGFLREERKAQ